MNDLQVFIYQNNEIRIVAKDGAPWWVLKDICDTLTLGSPHKVAERLDEDERSLVPVTDSLGRQQDTSVVNEAGLYNVILRSDKPEAKAFKRWVTHEVLPSIRKTGAYMTPETIEKVLLNPDTIIHLAEQIKSLQGENRALAAKNEMQQQVIGELQPKSDYVDFILSSTDTMTVTQIAADYNISARQLNKTLHEEHVQHKVNGQWILYREHMGKGYTKSQTFAFERSNGQPDVKPNTEWTQKGRLFINETLNRRGIFANIDLADVTA